MADVRTEEREDDEPARPNGYVDGAWGRTANPNTADGELQNIAAFAHGLTRLSGARRFAAQAVVWLILAAIAFGLIDGVVSVLR